MWRRDANIPKSFSGGVGGQRVWLSGVASVVVHIACLLAATMVVLPALLPDDAIRVSLRPGGGGNGRPAAPPANVPPSTAARAVAVPVPAAPRASKPKRSGRPRTITRPAEAPVELPTGAESDGALAAVGDVASSAGAGAGNGASGASGGDHGGGVGGGAGLGDGDDKRPYCDYCPEPTYPLIARRRGWKGTVDVGILLLADGHVDRAALRRSSGYDVLDREAIDVARRSRFRFPTTPAGPINGRIEYRFELMPSGLP